MCFAERGGGITEIAFHSRFRRQVNQSVAINPFSLLFSPSSEFPKQLMAKMMSTRFVRINATGVRIRTLHNVDVLKIWAQKKVQAILRRKNKKRGRKLKFRVSNGTNLLRLTLLRNTIKKAKAVKVVEVVETLPATLS